MRERGTGPKGEITDPFRRGEDKRFLSVERRHGKVVCDVQDVLSGGERALCVCVCLCMTTPSPHREYFIPISLDRPPIQ